MPKPTDIVNILSADSNKSLLSYLGNVIGRDICGMSDFELFAFALGNIRLLRGTRLYSDIFSALYRGTEKRITEENVISLTEQKKLWRELNGIERYCEYEKNAMPDDFGSGVRCAKCVEINTYLENISNEKHPPNSLNDAVSELCDACGEDTVLHLISSEKEYKNTDIYHGEMTFERFVNGEKDLTCPHSVLCAHMLTACQKKLGRDAEVCLEAGASYVHGYLKYIKRLGLLPHTRVRICSELSGVTEELIRYCIDGKHGLCVSFGVCNAAEDIKSQLSRIAESFPLSLLRCCDPFNDGRSELFDRLRREVLSANDGREEQYPADVGER